MSNLSFLAGHKAYRRLQQDGLQADSFKLVAGASGAAKWLVLSQLDRVIFGEFFKSRQDPLFLLGSSIGSWRFAAVSQKDPMAAIGRFEEAYIQQTYKAKPSAKVVTEKSYAILDSFLSPSGLDEVLNHPSFRLGLLSVRSQWPTVSENKLALTMGLISAGLANIATPEALRWFFQRTLFFDPRTPPPYLKVQGFATHPVALSAQNFRQALMSSGSIPLAMEGIRNIEGAPQGLYRDGGIVDYHLNVPFLSQDDEKLVLFPHFDERIIPGWFDKKLSWRKPHADRMAHVLLVAPSREFIARLPFGKIPDRSDFYRFQGRDEERFRYWRKVLDECRALADEFRDVVEKGLIAERVRPLPS